MSAQLLADLPIAFAALVAFCVVVYVLADGFDLGVGVLFLLAPRDGDRDLMMASIEPVWDGNETWLVMGGTLLLAVFPAGYYVLLPAFYLPIMAMLFALVFRGVAFGFRLQCRRRRRFWDLAFAGGSILAALCQGLVLGGVVEGVALDHGMFAGGPFDAFTLLGLLCGLGLLGGYALLGAAWLIWKTDGPTQVFAREVAHSATILTAAMLLAVSVWSAWSVPAVAERWFAWPAIAMLAPLPLAAAGLLLALWRRLWSGGDREPFLLAIGVFLLGFAGLLVSLWPYVVPRHVTLRDGIADPRTLAFVGVGVALVVPLVLAYQAHGYWIFRGKSRLDQGYGGQGRGAAHRPLLRADGE